MGCGSSRATVVPQQTVRAWSPTEEETKPHTEKKKISVRRRGSNGSVKIRSRKNSKQQTSSEGKEPLGSTVIQVQETKSICNSDGGSSHYSSRESINSSRVSSATSTITKSSAKSDDSGLGGENSHIITEKSDVTTKEVADLPSDMTTPDLTLHGLKMKSISPLRHRKRSGRLPPIRTKSGSSLNSKESSPSLPPKHVTFANSLIDELPESPSIIKRPCSRGGMAFDIMVGDTASDNSTTGKSRPSHLKKLERRRGPVTKEEIDEKQKEAKQRRIEQEQMMLERIRAKQEKDKQVAEALAKFAAMQMEMKAEVENKLKSSQENREAHFKALRDRLKEKSDKVQEAKLAKKTRKLAPLRPLRHPSLMRQSTEEVPVNLGAN